MGAKELQSRAPALRRPSFHGPRLPSVSCGDSDKMSSGGCVADAALPRGCVAAAPAITPRAKVSTFVHHRRMTHVCWEVWPSTHNATLVFKIWEWRRVAPASMCGRATRAQSAAARVLSPPGPDPIRPRRKRGEDGVFMQGSVRLVEVAVAFNTQRLSQASPNLDPLRALHQVGVPHQGCCSRHAASTPSPRSMHAIEGAEADAAAGVLGQSSGSDSPTNAPLPTGTVQGRAGFPVAPRVFLD